MRPGFGPAAELPASSPARRRHGGCSRHSVLRTSLAATAAPLSLRHAGPAAQLTPRTLGARIRALRIRARSGTETVVILGQQCLFARPPNAHLQSGRSKYERSRFYDQLLRV